MGNVTFKAGKLESVHPAANGALGDAVASVRFSPQSLTQNVVKETFDHSIEEYYDIDDQTVLGSGSNGDILMCIHKRTKMLYALKAFSKPKLTEAKIAQVRNELNFMTQLDHPNILRVHEVFENSNSIYLVNELCKGGDMLERLRKQPQGVYNERTACRYIHAILSATAYCHANDIVHCDLKLENIVFETQDKDSDIKIIDFGLSTRHESRKSLRKPIGTVSYVAPEVLEQNYDAKCDVWSIGVIAYMLLTGTAPFIGETDSDVLSAVRSGKWQFEPHMKNKISEEAQDFISKCLSRAFWRPTSTRALKHSWFKILERDKKTALPSPLLMRRMGNFVVRSWLAKIFIEVLAHTVLPEHTADLKAQFNKFDVSHTGDITSGDLRIIMRQFYGFRQDYVTTLMQQIDINQTGKISYHEFLAATINRKHFTEQNLLIAFELISGHKEHITSSDIKSLLGDSNYYLEPILETEGLSMHSKISFRDFLEIMGGHESESFLTERDEL